MSTIISSSNTISSNDRNSSSSIKYRDDAVSLPLSRVGIGSVFLKGNITDTRKIEKKEVIGTVKSKPSDFIVREISQFGPWRFHPDDQQEKKKTKTATATDDKEEGYMNGWDYVSLPGNSISNDHKSMHNHIACSAAKTMIAETSHGESHRHDLVSPPLITPRKPVADSSSSFLSESQKSTATSEWISESTGKTNNCDHMNPSTIQSAFSLSATPEEIVQQYLEEVERCLDGSIPEIIFSATKAMSGIRTLHSRVLSTCSNSKDGIATFETLYLPPLKPSTPQETPMNDDLQQEQEQKLVLLEKRKAFHAAFGHCFPFLKTGMILHKPSDTPNNNIAPQPLQQQPEPTQQKWIQVEADTMGFPLIPLLAHPLRDLTKFQTFRHDCFNPNIHNNNTPKVVELEVGESCNSKDDRRRMHHMISSISRVFQTGTRVVQKDIKRTFLTVQLSARAKMNQTRKRTRAPPPSSSSDKSSMPYECHHTIAVIQKENVEHLSMIQHLISAYPSLQSSDIGLAGMKDRRAITSQFVTLRNVSPAQLYQGRGELTQRSNACVTLVGATSVAPSIVEHNKNNATTTTEKWCSFLGCTNTLLNTGHLLGNEFEIIVRNIHFRPTLSSSKPNTATTAPNTHTTTSSNFIQDFISERVNDVHRNGFINFYGLQRVGKPSDSIKASDVGRAVLKGEYTHAIDLVISGRNNNHEFEDIQTARKQWIDERNIPQTLAALQSHSSSTSLIREKTLLRAMKRYGVDNPKMVWSCLPFGVRTFYVHAYQSLVWNKVATARAECGGIHGDGSHVMVGDLYLPHKVNPGTATVDEDITEPATKQPPQHHHQRNTDVKVVTLENVHTVDITQIVLPLPGVKITYPKNEIGQLYQALLQQDGISLVKHDITTNCPLTAEGVVPSLDSNNTAAISMAKGSYRHFIAQAHGLKWEPVVENETLEDNTKAGSDNTTISTMEEPSTKQLDTAQEEVTSQISTTKANNHNGNELLNNPNKDDSNNITTAIKFIFQLGSGSYATMMFRELFYTTHE